MIVEYLETLRKQPVEVRKRYTLFFTSVITGVIVAVWAIILFLNHYGSGESVKTVETNTVSSTEELFKSSNAFLNEGQTNSEFGGDWARELRELNEKGISDQQTQETKSSSSKSAENASTTIQQ